MNLPHFFKQLHWYEQTPLNITLLRTLTKWPKNIHWYQNSIGIWNFRNCPCHHIKTVCCHIFQLATRLENTGLKCVNPKNWMWHLALNLFHLCICQFTYLYHGSPWIILFNFFSKFSIKWFVFLFVFQSLKLFCCPESTAMALKLRDFLGASSFTFFLLLYLLFVSFFVFKVWISNYLFITVGCDRGAAAAADLLHQHGERQTQLLRGCSV